MNYNLPDTTIGKETKTAFCCASVWAPAGFGTSTLVLLFLLLRLILHQDCYSNLLVFFFVYFTFFSNQPLDHQHSVSIHQTANVPSVLFVSLPATNRECSAEKLADIRNLCVPFPPCLSPPSFLTNWVNYCSFRDLFAFYRCKLWISFTVSVQFSLFSVWTHNKQQPLSSSSSSENSLSTCQSMSCLPFKCVSSSNSV